jgi:coenzyme F420 hydrogenase subunit beta
MPRIRDLNDVVDWRLCVGCGACAYICPEARVHLEDVVNEGIRPRASCEQCGECRECLDVCPAVQSDYRHDMSSPAGRMLGSEWGPVLGLWEGHSRNPEVRFAGSSGGVITAIATYCVEVLGMHGVLHSAQDPDDPIRNRTRLSRTEAELLRATGSRYSPASVCDGLSLVEKAPTPCVIIGKPAEIAAVRNACRMRPGLEEKVGVALSFFCAGSPSTQGTVDLLGRLGVAPSSVSELRYRGCGWPGYFAPVKKGESQPCRTMSYRDSWACLQSYRPWSEHLWPDGIGELADITCGDPWYTEPDGENPGFSLVVARTEQGCRILRGAMAHGYLELTEAEAWKVERSQSGLLAKKGSVWGRRMALQLVGLPVTRLPGLSLWTQWKRLPVEEKLRSTFGTLRRIMTRRLTRRRRSPPDYDYARVPGTSLPVSAPP